MEIQWCWRCQTEVPMLNEEEYLFLQDLYGQCVRGSLPFRRVFGSAPANYSLTERFLPLIDSHERITGVRMESANAIMHHRRALFGPGCERCGKMLRAPHARKCFECGALAPALWRRSRSTV